jgi:hypothetical protein
MSICRAELRVVCVVTTPAPSFVGYASESWGGMGLFLTAGARTCKYVKSI